MPFFIKIQGNSWSWYANLSQDVFYRYTEQFEVFIRIDLLTLRTLEWLIFMVIIRIKILKNPPECILNTIEFLRKIDLSDFKSSPRMILIMIKMFGSENHRYGPIFMYLAWKIMKFAFVLILFLAKKEKKLAVGRIGLTHSKTDSMLKVYDHWETRLQEWHNYFPFLPISERQCVGEFFRHHPKSWLLPYKPKIKILAGLYWLLRGPLINAMN